LALRKPGLDILLYNISVHLGDQKDVEVRQDLSTGGSVPV